MCDAPMAPRTEFNTLEEEISQAVNEAIDRRERKLEEKLREVVGKREDAFQVYIQARNRTFRVVSFFLIVFFLLIFTPIGEWFGIKDGWVTPASSSSTAVAHDDAVVAATRNLITTLGPMVIGLVLWILATVGLNRFRQFDDSLETIRTSLEDKLGDFRQEMRTRDREARDRADGYDRQFRDRLDAFRRDISQLNEETGQKMRDDLAANVERMVGNEVSKQQTVIEAFFSDIKDEVKKSTESVETIRDEIVERFGHIADSTEYSKGESKLGPLTAVGPVQTMVEKLFGEGKRAEAITLTQELLHRFYNLPPGQRPSGSLKGDWFNLSAELGRADEYTLALEVCLAGLAQQKGGPVFDEEGKLTWTKDAVRPDDDVLAHAIEYASRSGDPRGETLIKLTGYDPETREGKPSWGWRTYNFVITALEGYGRGDEAIALGKNFLEQVAVNNDTGKVVETTASVMYRRGDHTKAIAFAKDWLRDNPYASGAQVVTTLLDWTDSDADYDEYFKLANRGIRDHAEDQQSTNLGNLFYRRALARDKRLLSALNENTLEGLDVCQEVRAAIQDYDMCLTHDVIAPNKIQSARRKSVLALIAKDHGCEDFAEASQGSPDGIPPPSKGADSDHQGAANPDQLSDVKSLVEQAVKKTLSVLSAGAPPEQNATAVNAVLASLPTKYATW